MWQKKTELTSTLTKLLGNVTPETIAGTCHYTNFGSGHFDFVMSEICPKSEKI